MQTLSESSITGSSPIVPDSENRSEGEAMKVLKVLIVDDSAVVRDRLASLLANFGGIEVSDKLTAFPRR
jgi:PleD family two-component response regulator